MKSSRDFTQLSYPTFHQPTLLNQFNFKNTLHAQKNVDASVKIKKMMDQVYEILTKMLENLNYVYQNNGIRYQVNCYLITLMRLLTPYELLSQFHVVNNFQMFEGTFKEKEKMSECQFRKKLKETKVLPKSRNIPEIKFKEQQEQFQNYSRMKLSEEWITKNTNRNRPMLGQETERDLTLWAIEQIYGNKDIKITDIRSKAKQLAYNVENFKCSSGWTERYFIRHPYLKKMMAQQRAGNMRFVQQMYFRIREYLMQPVPDNKLPVIKKREEDNSQEFMRISNSQLEAEVTEFQEVQSGWVEASFESGEDQEVKLIQSIKSNQSDN